MIGNRKNVRCYGSVEDALRVERDRRMAELRAENEKLKAAVRDSIRVEAEMFARLEAAEAEVRWLKELEGQLQSGMRPYPVFGDRFPFDQKTEVER